MKQAITLFILLLFTTALFLQTHAQELSDEDEIAMMEEEERETKLLNDIRKQRPLGPGGRGLPTKNRLNQNRKDTDKNKPTEPENPNESRKVTGMYVVVEPNPWVLSPEWSLSQVSILLYFLIVIALSAYVETLRAMPLGSIRTTHMLTGRLMTYKIPTQFGLAIIYALPPLIYIYDYFFYSANPYRFSFYHFLLLFTFASHFIKREIEIFYFHQTSKGFIDLTALPTISVAYTTFAAISAYYHNHVDTTTIFPNQALIGFAIYLIGEAINGYHQILLSKQEDVTKPPRGAMFEYILCPQYLGEIVSWFGFAMMSRHLFVWVAAVSFAAYLVARTRSTKRWYSEKFREGYCTKGLIPGVF